MNALVDTVRALLGRFRHLPPPEAPVDSGTFRSPVDAYWNAHTVNSIALGSAWQSRRYMQWRFRQYPLFREFMGLWGQHDGETILDYGCGPGDDVAGFLAHSRARRVIGADISARALELAKARAGLHREAEGRLELLLLSDAQPRIPLADGEVDYIHSGGVLHHSSQPDLIVREFARVLKPTGRACIMVYNRDSVWYHLYTAYVRMLEEGAFAGMSVEDAFARNVDGPNCPIARCYRPEQWLELCRAAGFETEFVGGYLSLREMQLLRQVRARAIADPRLAAEHRDFLSTLTFDTHGYPMHRGRHAGIGGVYRLRKRPA